MSIYGWAWGHGRLVPAKPAAQMSMDEALRGICFGAVLDISRCQQCAGKCSFGARVLELMNAGERPIPNNAPDPTRKEKELAARLKLNNRIMTRNNQRAKNQTADKVCRAEELIASGMKKIDAAKAVGYSGFQGLLAAQKAVQRREKARKA